MANITLVQVSARERLEDIFLKKVTRVLSLFSFYVRCVMRFCEGVGCRVSPQCADRESCFIKESFAPYGKTKK